MMANRELHLELLLSKTVRGITGDPVGRIEEVHARQEGEEWVVHEFLIGAGAVVSRLSAGRLSHVIAPLFGHRDAPHGYRVRWDQIDLSDPDHPRLRCRRDQLRVFVPEEAAPHN
jgi:hypothetical protein